MKFLQNRVSIWPFLFFLPWYYLPQQLSIAATHLVSSGSSISKAINRAVPGDTICIQGGDYFETLVIDKRLVIIGENYPRIHGKYQGDVVRVKAAGTVISNLTISEAGTRLIDDFACLKIEADSVTARNNIIDKPLHGIYVKGGSYEILEHNRIEGRLDLISADRGNGIHLWNSKHNRLIDNEIFNVRDGIYFSFADSTEVFRNHIHHVRYGLHYMYSNGNHFAENLFENNVAGAALMYSKNIFFERNVFARCRGFRSYGILYQSMDETRARDNLVVDNSRGIFFNDCNSNIFEHNDVADNDLAIQMMGDGEENVISHNNFINNLSSLLVNSKRTKTIWDIDSIGNYWSEYLGYDLDGDGLGDVAHKIQNVFQVLETNIPEVRFYLFSPAAKILEIAENALPILQLGTETDERPIFKPVKNELVPWSKAGELTSGTAPVFAVVYLFLGGFPVLILLRLSRHRRRKV